MLLASGFVEALAEFAVLDLQLGQAADETTVLALEGLSLLGQPGQASAEVSKFAVLLLAADTLGRVRGHRNLHKRWWARARLFREALEPRCIPIVEAASRCGSGLGRGCFASRAKT
jgi:hypothetical protein